MRTIPAVLWLLLLAGCASSTEDAKQNRPIRFVVIGAPAIGGVPVDPEFLNEDLLLEAVTQLSTEEELDFCLVPGPLLMSDEEEARESLVGGVGSLAAISYVALGPDDGPREALLELLEESLEGHEGEAAYFGKRVRGVRPVILGPDGAWPEPDPQGGGDDEDPPTLIVLQGGESTSQRAALTVLSGPQLSLEALPGGARLVVPPIAQPPHLYVIATLSQGELVITVRSALELPVPDPPASIRLTLGTAR